MYTKKYNYVSFLSNATLQKLLKLYVEQTNLFENYHYNLSIQYYFLPTNLININTNSSELNDLITQINLLINNSVRIKYLINDIKNSTAYKPVNQFFEDSFYENDNKYRTLNIVSNNFELFSDLAISHKTVKKNIFSEYDAIIHKFDYTKINTPVYNLRMKY
ncbi:MAG: hypothetical protein N2Z58_09345, partial [Fervidobacterium sp.]|nr:hypothetical protein [Fervidobacterium sp.]